MPAKVRKKFIIQRIEVSATTMIINGDPLDLSGFEMAEKFNDIEGLSIAKHGEMPTKYGVGTIDGWIRTIYPGGYYIF